MATDTTVIDETEATSTSLARRTLIEGAVGIFLLVMAFSAVAISDVSSMWAHSLWGFLVLLFGIVTFVTDRHYASHGLAPARSAFAILLHWFGVFCAVQLVYFFVATGRMANADTGLTNGLLLGIGAFLAGVHINKRFLILGIAISAAVAGVAFVEEYLWVLFGIALLAIVSLLIGVRLTKRHRTE